MTKYLINYAAKGTNCSANHPNGGYFNAQILNSKTGKEVAGFDHVISYGKHSLSTDFVNRHEKHFQYTRGAGYWAWKPQICLDALDKISNGDILMYSDSGCHFVHSMSPVFERLENAKSNVLCFNIAQIEKDWNKRDCFVSLNCDFPEYTDTKQIMSTFLLCKKNDFAYHIINEWQRLVSDFHMVSDEFLSPSKTPNYPSFKEHRHDQSLLSLVCKKNSVSMMEDITEWGDPHLRGTPQIVAHTRRTD
jgi:hypothetical protein